MENFELYLPTKIFFGKGSIENLKDVIAAKGKRVLLVYGGGSIRRSGLYDRIRELLEGFEIFELSGVEPNPKYTTNVLPGIEICRKEKIDVILAVGGGSVMDCAKVIGVGTLYDGDCWDLISAKVVVTETLPVVTITTLSATGSEYDNSAVVTRTETNEKQDYIDDVLFPYASIMDPEYTFTVPKRQIAAGTCDAITHYMEMYFSGDHNMFSDGMMESGTRTLIYNGKLALENPDDYEVRGELMLACAYACNNMMCPGNGKSGWPLHAMEHTLSGFYDIIHGEGLTIITPAWMEHILSDETVERFVSFGTHVFGIDPDKEAMEIARETIQALHDTFESMGAPLHLKEVGIDESRIKEMAHHIVTHTEIESAWIPLNEQDIIDIFTKSL